MILGCSTEAAQPSSPVDEKELAEVTKNLALELLQEIRSSCAFRPVVLRMMENLKESHEARIGLINTIKNHIEQARQAHIPLDTRQMTYYWIIAVVRNSFFKEQCDRAAAVLWPSSPPVDPKIQVHDKEIKETIKKILAGLTQEAQQGYLFKDAAARLLIALKSSPELQQNLRFLVAEWIRGYRLGWEPCDHKQEAAILIVTFIQCNE